MRPRNVAFVCGLVGLVVGFILLPDVPGGSVFGMLVFGFIGYECTWALTTITQTKAISKGVEKKQKQKTRDTSDNPD